MQKVIRRTILAEKQAARKLSRKKETATRSRLKSNRNQANYSRKEETSQIKEARLVRREDWELGPLAPRRDVGDSKDTYGTISNYRVRGPLLRNEEIREKLKPFGGKYMNLVSGDRAVILDGSDKGKIGKVLSIDVKRAECIIQGLNMADIAVPKYMVDPDDPDQRPVRTIETPVSLDAVRLVHALTDPETGVTRDVIVKKVVNGPMWHDRHSGTTRWSRLIPGLNVVIPWPKKEPKEHKDFPNDTLRMEVEARSFIPTLLRPPMPSSVIDELRNKYSIFRTRHDAEYIAAKQQEDLEKEEKKKLAEEMRTPLKEINRKERKLRKAKGKGRLTPEMLEKIGQVIARKRQTAMDAAGVSKEEGLPTTVVA